MTSQKDTLLVYAPVRPDRTPQEDMADILSKASQRDVVLGTLDAVKVELSSLLCELDSAATSQVKVESAKEKLRELLENLNEQFFTPDNL
jgi:hypothetical protein